MKTVKQVLARDFETKVRCVFLRTFLFVLMGFFMFLSLPARADLILNKQDVEILFQSKLENIRSLIADNDIEGIKQAARDFTHDKTIVLFEFTLSMPDISALPSQRAYFNREPFIELMSNAGLLEVESFEMTYNLDKFQPQFGGGSAIVYDSGAASGQMTEPFSGNLYNFAMTQECRNTISAHAEHMFKVDSIYCRMNIEYEPVRKIIVPIDGPNAKPLEKAPIADIISDLEDKQTQE